MRQKISTTIALLMGFVSLAVAVIFALIQSQR